MRSTPFTILTGWLGAGKTSALNRMLASQVGPGAIKIAVLVNELGRIAIDTQLIVNRGGDVLELAGGCVCCKVDLKNDLWDGIGEIVTRSEPDCVVLETTGIAEPSAILDGLVKVSASVRERIRPAGVVCVVDAEAGGAALTRREEARDQAAAADRVLMSKLDAASPESVRATHALLDEHAPEAERAGFPQGEAGARALTAWVTEPRKVRAWTMAQKSQGAHHHHDDRHGQLVAVSVSIPGDSPLVGERVMAVLASLGDRLVRAKGFVHLAGDDRRGYVEYAGTRLELAHGDWGDAPRRTELVVIGDDLDEGAVHRALWACRAAG